MQKWPDSALHWTARLLPCAAAGAQEWISAGRGLRCQPHASCAIVVGQACMPAQNTCTIHFLCLCDARNQCRCCAGARRHTALPQPQARRLHSQAPRQPLWQHKLLNIYSISARAPVTRTQQQASSMPQRRLRRRSLTASLAEPTAQRLCSAAQQAFHHILSNTLSIEAVYESSQ